MNPTLIVGALAVIAFFAMAATALAKGVSVQTPNKIGQWNDLANKYAQINSILDPEEILAIIWTESSGDVNQSNPHDPSWGLMGVTPLIAHAYGGFDSSDTSWHTDPEKNVKAGSAFLADLKDKYSGSNPGWVAGYNEGETNLLKGYLDQSYVDTFNAHLAALKGAS